ncbi:hypothetical protein EGW08_001102 [Elysia chlorotica]|uniref:WD repeat-containing protein 55 homolog n=1 Tax=Elysia chlorotica TaxID=188477 RepID=A0A3S1BTG4_ELYCH|nr:hypothetical protein EGW08_001102 [Elysia chlorotica]
MSEATSATRVWSPDNEANRKIKSWQVTQEEIMKALKTPANLSDEITLTHSPQRPNHNFIGYFADGAQDFFCMSFLDANTPDAPQLLQTLHSGASMTCMVHFRATTGEVFTGAAKNRQLYVWTLNNKNSLLTELEPMQKLKAPGEITCMVFIPKCRTYVGYSTDKTLRVMMDPVTGCEDIAYLIINHVITCLTYNKDTNEVVAGGKGFIESYLIEGVEIGVSGMSVGRAPGFQVKRERGSHTFVFYRISIHNFLDEQVEGNVGGGGDGDGDGDVSFGVSVFDRGDSCSFGGVGGVSGSGGCGISIGSGVAGDISVVDCSDDGGDGISIVIFLVYVVVVVVVVVGGGGGVAVAVGGGVGGVGVCIISRGAGADVDVDVSTVGRGGGGGGGDDDVGVDVSTVGRGDGGGDGDVKDLKVDTRNKQIMVLSTNGINVVNYSIWNAVVFTQVHEFPGHVEKVTAICALPKDPILFSSSSDGTVFVWRMDTFQKFMKLRVGEAVCSMRVLKNGTLVAQTAQAIMTYSLKQFYSTFTSCASGVSILKRLRSHGHGANRIMVSTEDGRFQLFNPVTGALVSAMLPLPKHQKVKIAEVLVLSTLTHPFRALEVLHPPGPDFRVVCLAVMVVSIESSDAAGEKVEDTVIFMGTSSGAICVLESKAVLMESPTQAHAGGFVAMSSSCDVDPVSSRLRRTSRYLVTAGNDNLITALDMCPMINIFVTCGADGHVKIWDTNNQLIREMAFGQPVSSVCIANNRGDLLIGFQNRVLFDPRAVPKYSTDLVARMTQKVKQKANLTDDEAEAMTLERMRSDMSSESGIGTSIAGDESRPALTRENTSLSLNDALEREKSNLSQEAGGGAGRRDAKSGRTSRGRKERGKKRQLDDLDLRKVSIGETLEEAEEEETKAPSTKELRLAREDSLLYFRKPSVWSWGLGITPEILKDLEKTANMSRHAELLLPDYLQPQEEVKMITPEPQRDLEKTANMSRHAELLLPDYLQPQEEVKMMTPEPQRGPMYTEDQLRSLTPWERFLLTKKPIIAPDGYIPNSVVRRAAVPNFSWRTDKDEVTDLSPLARPRSEDLTPAKEVSFVTPVPVKPSPDEGKTTKFEYKTQTKPLRKVDIDIGSNLNFGIGGPRPGPLMNKLQPAADEGKAKSFRLSQAPKTPQDGAAEAGERPGLPEAQRSGLSPALSQTSTLTSGQGGDKSGAAVKPTRKDSIKKERKGGATGGPAGKKGARKETQQPGFSADEGKAKSFRLSQAPKTPQDGAAEAGEPLAAPPIKKLNKEEELTLLQKIVKEEWFPPGIPPILDLVNDELTKLLEASDTKVFVAVCDYVVQIFQQLSIGAKFLNRASDKLTKQLSGPSAIARKKAVWTMKQLGLAAKKDVLSALLPGLLDAREGSREDLISNLGDLLSGPGAADGLSTLMSSLGISNRPLGTKEEQVLFIGLGSRAFCTLIRAQDNRVKARHRISWIYTENPKGGKSKGKARQKSSSGQAADDKDDTISVDMSVQTDPRSEGPGDDGDLNLTNKRRGRWRRGGLSQFREGGHATDEEEEEEEEGEFTGDDGDDEGVYGDTDDEEGRPRRRSCTGIRMMKKGDQDEGEGEARERRVGRTMVLRKVEPQELFYGLTMI